MRRVTAPPQRNPAPLNSLLQNHHPLRQNHHDLHQVQEVSSLQTAISTGFQAIFQYISGANSLAEKIEMTAPVRVEVLAPQGPYCKANVTTSFFLPWSFQNSSAIPKATRP